VVPEPAKSIAAFRSTHRKRPLGQHAVLIPDLLRPDPRNDFPGIVEAVAQQAKGSDLQVGKGDIGGMHDIAGIRIADPLRGKVQHHVQRHAVANRIAVNAKLDAELGADLAGDFGRFRDEMPIGCGADCAGRRQLAGAARRAHRLSPVGARIGDGDAGNGRRRRDHGCSLRPGRARHGGEQRYDEHRQPHETSRVAQAANSLTDGYSITAVGISLQDLLWAAVRITASLSKRLLKRPRPVINLPAQSPSRQV
jgi:hypothetical protein